MQCAHSNIYWRGTVETEHFVCVFAGAITNILLVPTPPDLLNNDKRQDMPIIAPFKRHLQKDSSCDSQNSTETVSIHIRRRKVVLKLSYNH